MWEQRHSRGTGAERDRWMEKAKREEDCEGGTDGAQKGDGSREGNGRLRKERDRVNR